MQITKRSAKAALGFLTDVEFASFLGCSKQAVSKMLEDEPLPDGRQWQLRALRPDLFPLEQGAPPQAEAA